MASLMETIILGLIQGLTEWLPISSTGHLRLAEQFMDLHVPILLDVVLHVGTLAVVLVFFWRDIKSIIFALSRLDFSSEHGQLIPAMLVGTIPTVAIGIVFGNTIEETFRTAVPIGAAFILCGVVLVATRNAKEWTNSISYATALLVGVAQGIAIIPGISRSGITIAAALLIGVRRDKAFRFSFLLSIPAIVGALGLSFYKQYDALAATGVGLLEILAGVLVAMLTGYVALQLLSKAVARKRFYLFASYCWLLGAVLLVLSLSGF